LLVGIERPSSLFGPSCGRTLQVAGCRVHMHLSQSSLQEPANTSAFSAEFLIVMVRRSFPRRTGSPSSCVTRPPLSRTRYGHEAVRLAASHVRIKNQLSHMRGSVLRTTGACQLDYSLTMNALPTFPTSPRNTKLPASPQIWGAKRAPSTSGLLEFYPFYSPRRT